MNQVKITGKELQIYPFVVPIYEWTIVLLVGDEQSALDLIEGAECVEIARERNNYYLGSTLQPKSTIYIWYPKDTKIHVKGHEILHATFHLLNSIGVDVSDQEAVCYLFDYILKQCLTLDGSYTQMDHV